MTDNGITPIMTYKRVNYLKKPDKNKRNGILKLILFALIMLVMTILFGRPIISAVKDPIAFRSWVESCGFAGKIVFFLMMYIQTVIAFIPGEPLEIAAGYAFGAIPGLIITMLGQMLGSVTVFLFVRKFGTKLVQVFVSREQIASMRFLRDEKKLEILTFLIFLTPGTPKDALCYFVGLTPMRLGVWILISSFARIPSILTSTIGGNALGIGSVPMAAVVFAITFLISACGYIMYLRYTAKRREKSEDSVKMKTNKPMDAILLLGLRLKNGCEPEQELIDRARVACEVFQKGTAPVIIVCGGQVKENEKTEAEVMEALLVEMGVPKDRIIREDKSKITYENINNARAILNKKRPRVAVVTSDYHIRRSLLLCRIHKMRAEGFSCETPDDEIKAYRKKLEVRLYFDTLLGFQKPGRKRPLWYRALTKILMPKK